MQNPLDKLRQIVLVKQKQSSLRLFIALFFALLLLVILAGMVQRNDQQFIENPREQVIPASRFIGEHPQIMKNASIINLGLYLDSIYDLNLSKTTFKARGWLWYTWTKSPLINGKTDPGQMGNFDFNFQDEIDVNQVISSRQPIAEIANSGRNIYWNETSFDAKLAAPGISLRNYPFDSQKLSLLVTNPVHETGELLYEIQQFRLPPSRFNISGYMLDGIDYAEEVRVYTSNFADASGVSPEKGGATTQSQAAFNIFISRNFFTSLLEYAMPITIVSFLAVSVVRLGDRFWEVKLTAPPAAILSLIFLQNTFGQDLPRVSYMTCMDLMFLIGYLVCLLSFADALLVCLSSDSGRSRGVYGRVAGAILALSPLIIKGWLSLPS
jgi:hypothetical protein